MVQKVRISIDLMGGDSGPPVVAGGCAEVLERRPDVHFVFFGTEEGRRVLEAEPRLKDRYTFHATDVVIAMDEKPSQALRRGRGKSSMWCAIDAVRNGDADVCVSGGNTGALMAMAKFCLRTMSGVERPAIAAIWPTARSESIVLDVGATIGADSQQLFDFAVMGGAMARSLFHVQRPTIGLLNVGVEEVKGVDEVREAARLLRDADLPNISYAGFVEGDDISKGTVDVVVTEGFSGNIALKTAEGTAKQVASFLRTAINRSLMARIGYIFARGAFAQLRAKLDPRKHNGGVFLGLNGIVIKSHGGTDATGFASAVELAYDMSRNGLIDKIRADLASFYRGELQSEDIAVEGES